MRTKRKEQGGDRGGKRIAFALMGVARIQGSQNAILGDGQRLGPGTPYRLKIGQS